MNPRNHVYDKLAQRAKFVGIYGGTCDILKFAIRTKPLRKLNPNRLP